MTRSRQVAKKRFERHTDDCSVVISDSSGRPNAPELAADFRRELPELEGSWVRAMHDVNQELADYIRENLTVDVSGFTRFFPIRNVLSVVSHPFRKLGRNFNGS